MPSISRATSCSMPRGKLATSRAAVGLTRPSRTPICASEKSPMGWQRCHAPGWSRDGRAWCPAGHGRHTHGDEPRRGRRAARTGAPWCRRPTRRWKQIAGRYGQLSPLVAYRERAPPAGADRRLPASTSESAPHFAHAKGNGLERFSTVSARCFQRPPVGSPRLVAHGAQAHPLLRAEPMNLARWLSALALGFLLSGPGPAEAAEKSGVRPNIISVPSGPGSIFGSRGAVPTQSEHRLGRVRGEAGGAAGNRGFSAVPFPALRQRPGRRHAGNRLGARYQQRAASDGQGGPAIR